MELVKSKLDNKQMISVMLQIESVTCYRNEN